MVLVRSISRAKWEEHSSYAECNLADLKADSMIDLRTSGDTLSFWEFDSVDNLELFVIAFASARDNLSKLEAVYVDKNSIAAIFPTESSKGSSPAECLTESHLDIVQLTVPRLVQLSEIFKQAIRNDNQWRLFRKQEVRDILCKAIKDGLISLDKIKPELAEELSAYLTD